MQKQIFDLKQSTFVKDDVMFCSPFRRRRKKTECYLTREEAWEMYLAKMEEEANYFTVTDVDASESDADICTCQTCIVSKRKSK